MMKRTLGWVCLAACVACAPSAEAPSEGAPEERVERPKPALTPLKVSEALEAKDHVPAEPGALAGSNLLLVTLDTTRADRIGCYGNGAIETPTLDRLAAEGVVFSDVTAVAPITMPSHASVLTGLYPNHHGVHTNGLYHLPEEHETLAERLQASGYETGAVISAFVLDSQFGLAQGFDNYDDDLSQSKAVDRNHFKERSARATTARALNWLQERGEGPFFLWVHYFDPHHDYAPPSPFKEEYKQNPYDGEIAYMDFALAELLEGLAAEGVADSTLVAVVGDHGEGLGQHHEYSHAYLTYDSTLRVPLILHAGDRLGGGVHCTRPASQVDVAPTLLSLLGLGFSEETDGHDLLTPDAPEHPRFFESVAGALEYGWEPLTGVSLGEFKYIHSSEPELFHRTQDPEEETNLVAEHPEAVAERLALLHAAFGDGFRDALEPTLEPTLEELENLEALGYFESGGLADKGTGPTMAPKDMMLLMHRVAMAEEPSKPPKERAEALIAITQDAPDFYPAWKALGNIYKHARKYDEAAQALERCMELRPDIPRTVYDLAFVRARQSRHEESAALLKPVVEQYPDYAGARYFYAAVLAYMGRMEEAIVEFEAVLEVAPNHQSCAERLAAAYDAAGRGEEVLPRFRAWLEKDPLATKVRITLATEMEKRGDPEGADAVLREGLVVNPEDGDLVRHLVLHLARNPDPAKRDREAAIEVLAPFVARLDPPPVAALLTLSTLYSNTNRMDQALELSRRAVKCALPEGGPVLVQSAEAHLKALEQRKAAGE